MDMLCEVYYKRLAENHRHLQFWENYLQNLRALDFIEFRENLKVPVLVPIGSRILFRGELNHTNEVTVSLGADYFVKCSVAQANIIRQHRINVAKEKIDTYMKEKNYLQDQVSFTKQNVYDDQGREIIEYHTDEEDKAWKLKHLQNVKEYMQKRAKEKKNKHHKDEITDQKLWERFEELELQEELESELSSNDDVNLSEVRSENFGIVVRREDYLDLSKIKKKLNDMTDQINLKKEITNTSVRYKESKAPEQLSKLDLLQQVIARQNELVEKLHELKSRKTNQCKTNQDLVAKLDEMEQLEELEDEMDRLENMIQNEDLEESEVEETGKSEAVKLERRVSFVDEADSETLNLTFKHSKVAPNNTPYDPKKGIQKPSDIYEANANLFGSGITSILKKPKYANDGVLLPDNVLSKPVEVKKKFKVPIQQLTPDKYIPIPAPTIIVKDVLEIEGQNKNKIQKEIKPVSLFKKKRMQNKPQFK